MDLELRKAGEPTTDVITTTGLTLSGFITLADQPNTFAATKDYTDSKFSNLNLSNCDITTITDANFISRVSGDLTATSRTNVRLANIVTAGTYPVVTLNAKGLVTSGRAMVSSDLPNLPWSKIALDVSSNDHGITDGVLTTGSSITGNILLAAPPESALQATSKGYVDAVVSNIAGFVQPGDLMLKKVGVSYPGYLSCNGAELSRTTYPNLYAAIADTYSVLIDPGVKPGSGQPWREQYDFNSKQVADLTPWTIGTAMPATIVNSQSIMTKSRVYMLGGLVNGSLSSAVYTTPINANGTLGTWAAGTALPGTIAYSQVIVISGVAAGTSRVYLLGGTINSAASGVVYTATIDTTGLIGVWSTVTPLPVTLTYSQAIVTNTRVYLLGGFVNGTVSSAVYSAPINADGSLGIWTLGTALPATVAYSQAVVTKNRVYLLGGQIAGANSAVVYTAPIASDGTLGAWTTSTSMPGTIAYSQSILTKGKLYMIGGVIAGSNSAVVYNAPVNTDGTLGAWVTGTALPVTNRDTSVIITSSLLYLLGGTVSSSASSAVYSSPFTGGFNDYADIYNGVYSATASTNFKIPDLSATVVQGMGQFIKT